MTIKRKDFQKAAAMVHEFLLKLGFEPECSELRDALNLALLHMQRYYRLLRTRMANIDKTSGSILAQSLRGLSPMTPFKDAPDKFQWRWINLDNPKVANHLPPDVNRDVSKLPDIICKAKDGKDEQIMKLIDKDPDSLFEVDGLGRNALMYAVHFGHLDTVQILLENGVDVNAPAHDGSTAAHRACHDGNHEALQILISYGANVSVADTQGRYPIHWACASKKRDCLRLLIDQKVNVNVRDKEGMSPSMWACRMDHIDHFELLTQAEQVMEEEDGIERDQQGKTWIHWSVRRTEPLECLRTLLTEDSADWRDEEGKSVMHTCAEQGSLAATKVVLEIAGSGVLDHRDNDNRTPLVLAACGGHGEVLNYLLSQGADHACVDNFNATAWDYARAKQLHYCMLIVASYIRQRAKEEEKNERDYDGLPSGDVNDFELSGMGSLQINGGSNGEQLYYGNKPIAPPHPPTEPPTPRTPRHNPSTPRLASTTPRGGMVGWQTPQQSARSPPPTARGAPAAKRLPSTSDSNGENGHKSYNRPSKRESTAGKRRKNEPRSPEREGRMSVHSINSSQEFAETPRYDAEPEMQAESEYLNETDSEHAEQVSIAAMDVSDFEPGLEGDDERTIIEEDEGRLQPMESEKQLHRQTQNSRDRRDRERGRERTKDRDRSRGNEYSNGVNSINDNGGGTNARQSSSSTRQSSHAPHPQPRQSPPGYAHSQHQSSNRHSAHQPYYNSHPNDHYDDDDEGEIVHTPSPPPRHNKPYSYHKPPAPSPTPPPHLQPLPPPSPGKKKKKKKKDREGGRMSSPQLAPVAGPVPPHRGYAAPMQPPGSPHPSSASSHNQHPSSPRGRSPTSRNSSAHSSLSRNSQGAAGGGGGNLDPLYSGGNQVHQNSLNYMSGGLVGSRPPSMKVNSNKVQGFNHGDDYRHSDSHASLNQIPTENKPPVFPKAAPRTKSQKLHPLSSKSANHQSSRSSNSRGQGQQRMGSGSSQQRYSGMPNGNVQNGYGDNQPQQSRGYPQKHSRTMGSGGRKRSGSHPADRQPPASPRGAPPPMSGKHMANGRLPPTY